MTVISPAPVRLPVPRHLQDCNGYCGPACVMMVLSGERAGQSAAAMEGQHELFRRVREHAKQANDRRPVKSPAESLLALLEPSGRKWRKIFDAEPGPVAQEIVSAVERAGQPCLMLVSKGMHWVVAFGRTLRDDGTVAGVLLRDPAWAGMPKFFGLTTLPEKPTFTHTAHDPCTCLASDNPPGSVHERYIAMDELLSPRGLQGSPDWEGKGALALVPADARAAGVVIPAAAAAAPLAGLTPQQAAMQEAREHGLFGRADSPPDWQAVMQDGQPGTPILVKDPNDPHDDFYLVPVHPPAGAPDVSGHDRAGSGCALRTAWIMLDPQTLRLREASLLDHWMLPAFPTDQDADNISDNDVTLPDGTRHRFKKSELRPNQRNLVWQASAASILPYWPVKEFTAAHPVTKEAVSIYTTQIGEILTALGPDDLPATQVGNDGTQGSDARNGTGAGGTPWLKLAAMGAVAAVAGIFLFKGPSPEPQADTALSWDPATAFSTASNPNGVWSYGYSRGPGDFIPFSTSSTRYGLPSWRENFKDKENRDTHTPQVGCNGSDAPISFPAMTVGPGEMHLHPGPNNELAVLRFTAPDTSSYTVSGSFFGQDHQTSTDVHLLVDGTELWKGDVQGFGKSSSVPFSVTMALTSGSHLDFVVGSGGNGYLCDSTGLFVQIGQGSINGRRKEQAVRPPAQSPAPAPALTPARAAAPASIRIEPGAPISATMPATVAPAAKPAPPPRPAVQAPQSVEQYPPADTKPTDTKPRTR